MNVKRVTELPYDEHFCDTLVHIEPMFRLGKLRLLARWCRFGLRSLCRGYLDFAANAIRAEFHLARLWVGDIIGGETNVECSICGWRGSRFYPNVGPGYYELETMCPRCLCLDRYRSLAVLLQRNTKLFDADTEVIEVAPARVFQQYCLELKGNKNYISFDLSRYAMERGDVTRMRYADASADYFLCFHVLEHISGQLEALEEIRRVLRSGGCAVFQVPIDWEIEKTIEYGSPNPRETGHVRRYGKDFGEILESHGFKVTGVSISDFLPEHQIKRYGLSTEPVFLAERQQGA